LARAVASPRRVRSANLRPSSCPAAAAVPADLVGLSCGVEAAEDFVEDLRRALAP
jgi:O-acetylhomoserine/O-acetylserine sulfhydrylase-like pyridoxal-dependent enzyme